MKISAILIASTLVASSLAFAPARELTGKTTSSTITTSSLAASRRDVFHQASLWGVGAAVLFNGATPQAANADGRPTYLTEPTEEFKANESKAMEFKRAQLEKKQGFVKVLDRISTTSRSEADLVRDLNELQDMVIATGGLPSGIKKEDMYKDIRRVKAMGNWPTNVEIAYQALKAEIGYQQSPNTEKDSSNPL